MQLMYALLWIFEWLPLQIYVFYVVFLRIQLVLLVIVKCLFLSFMIFMKMKCGSEWHEQVTSDKHATLALIKVTLLWQRHNEEARLISFQILSFHKCKFFTKNMVYVYENGFCITGWIGFIVQKVHIVLLLRDERDEFSVFNLLFKWK